METVLFPCGYKSRVWQLIEKVVKADLQGKAGGGYMGEDWQADRERWEENERGSKDEKEEDSEGERKRERKSCKASEHNPRATGVLQLDVAARLSSEVFQEKQRKRRRGRRERIPTYI